MGITNLTTFKGFAVAIFPEAFPRVIPAAILNRIIFYISLKLTCEDQD
jgi:hypothetical protein